MVQTFMIKCAKYDEAILFIFNHLQPISLRHVFEVMDILVGSQWTYVLQVELHWSLFIIWDDLSVNERNYNIVWVITLN